MRLNVLAKKQSDLFWFLLDAARHRRPDTHDQALHFSVQSETGVSRSYVETLTAVKRAQKCIACCWPCGRGTNATDAARNGYFISYFIVHISFELFETTTIPPARLKIRHDASGLMLAQYGAAMYYCVPVCENAADVLLGGDPDLWTTRRYEVDASH